MADSTYHIPIPRSQNLRLIVSLLGSGSLLISRCIWLDKKKSCLQIFLVKDKLQPGHFLSYPRQSRTSSASLRAPFSGRCFLLLISHRSLVSYRPSASAILNMPTIPSCISNWGTTTPCRGWTTASWPSMDGLQRTALPSTQKNQRWLLLARAPEIVRRVRSMWWLWATLRLLYLAKSRTWESRLMEHCLSTVTLTTSVELPTFTSQLYVTYGTVSITIPLEQLLARWLEPDSITATLYCTVHPSETSTSCSESWTHWHEWS